MKIRIGLAAIAAGALALGLAAPGVAGAAPTAAKPSGKALVRIDTGTAIAKEKSKGTYRVIVPTGAYIGWLGEVDGKGSRIGTFTPEALVAGWSRMGHRDGRLATATLTWDKSGGKSPRFIAASLKNPRINSDGRLTFIAKVDGKLPKNMVGFTINVNRATNAVRFPIPGAIIAIDKMHSVQGTQTSESAGNAGWTGSDDAGSVCSEVTEFPIPGTHYLAEDIVCAGLIIHAYLGDGSRSYVQTQGNQVAVSTAFSYEDGSTTQSSSGAQPRAGILLTFFALMMNIF